MAKTSGSCSPTRFERFPGNLLIVFHEGRYLVDHGRYEEALPRFERLLAVDLATLPDAGPSYAASIFGELSYEGLAVCLFHLGRYAEAAEAWGKATEAAPDDPSYEAKRQLALARCGKALAHRTDFKSGPALGGLGSSSGLAVGRSVG